LPQVTRVAGVVFLIVAGLLLRRLPEANPDRPAIRPALALSLAWLLTWPYEFPWYDTMAFCLLGLYANTTDLSRAGSHESLTWDFAGLRGGLPARGAPGRRLGV
jgi:hypothetical protein